MRVEPLSQRDERRIMNVIEGAINSVKASPTMLPDDALSKAASAARLEPELVKRACEAFNKAKSVYMLTKLGSEKRAEAFPLADADKVVASMYGTPKVEPELKISRADYSGYGLTECKAAMEKAAAETEKDEECCSDGKCQRCICCNEGKVSSARAQTNRLTQEHEEKQAESECRQHRLASELAIDNIVGRMKRMGAVEMQKVARLTVNKFQGPGKEFVSILAYKLDADLPMEKTAEHAIFPAEEPYISIDRVFEEASKYVASKEACLKKKFKLAKSAQISNVQALVGTALAPAVAMAKTPISEYFSKERGLSPADISLFAPTFQYKLKNFQNTQSFIDVASDSFVKNYKMDNIVEAFNHVIGTMPELSDPRYRQVLTSLVRKQLAQENLFDPAELANMAKTMKDIVSTEQARSEVEGAMGAKLEEAAAETKAPISEALASEVQALDPFGSKQVGSGSEKAPRTPKAQITMDTPAELSAKARRSAAQRLYEAHKQEQYLDPAKPGPGLALTPEDRKLITEELGPGLV